MNNQKNHFKINYTKFSNGDRIPMLCRDGIPLYETTDWAISSLWPEGNASNTIAAKLRDVGHWLRWCEEHRISWDERVRSGEFLTPDEISSVRTWMRLPIGTPVGVKVTKLRVTRGVQGARMIFVAQYLGWIAEQIIYRIQGSRHDHIEAEYLKWQTRWRKLIPEPDEPRDRGQRFGLDTKQQDLFLEVIHPDCDRNPFEKGMRVRNYALFITLIEHGLRMAEPLMLKTRDLLFGEHQIRVPGRRNDPQDPRKVIPSPKKGKNFQQGGGRRLDFTVRSQKALEAWMMDRRDETRFPAARKSPYVFVSERGLPLSVRRVHSIFESLREAHPELGIRFSPHVLRHTFVEEFIRAHPEFTQRDRQNLLYLLDWTMNSKMPECYGWPAIREAAGKAGQELSERRHARALRILEKEESGL